MKIADVGKIDDLVKIEYSIFLILMGTSVVFLFNTLNERKFGSFLLIALILLLVLDNLYGSKRRYKAIEYDMGHFFIVIIEMFIFIIIMAYVVMDNIICFFLFSFYGLHGIIWDIYNIKRFEKNPLYSIDLFSSLLYAIGITILPIFFGVLLVLLEINSLEIGVSLLFIALWAIWRLLFYSFQQDRIKKYYKSEDKKKTVSLKVPTYKKFEPPNRRKYRGVVSPALRIKAGGADTQSQQAKRNPNGRESITKKTDRPIYKKGLLKKKSVEKKYLKL